MDGPTDLQKELKNENKFIRTNLRPMKGAKIESQRQGTATKGAPQLLYLPLKNVGVEKKRIQCRKEKKRKERKGKKKKKKMNIKLNKKKLKYLK